MSSKIDRIGETRINNFGSKMIIVGYRNTMDIDVYFPEYNWTYKGTTYSNFKIGLIKCPYEKRYYGVGYLGEGKHKSRENGKDTRVYKTWKNMLQRCYDSKFHEKQPTYKNCKVCDEWLNFQNFAEWYENNYYTVEGETMCLDKDILYKGNKIYSPENCIFVPKKINSLFVKSNKIRGESPIGTTLHQGKYVAYCHMINPKTGKSKRKHLGIYDTQEKAFQVYKYHKENYIKEVADYFKEHIPQKLYNAMYNYEVEITD